MIKIKTKNSRPSLPEGREYAPVLPPYLYEQFPLPASSSTPWIWVYSSTITCAGNRHSLLKDVRCEAQRGIHNQPAKRLSSAGNFLFAVRVITCSYHSFCFATPKCRKLCKS
ncbi:hypothetical protein DSY3829 [Desulfitobacterium hafniense Y51]|uniref:Uncharacterized protein n=1 Tax=Desulfitobacterium hafniense (strain Y51) TaxID=138119 RepID=Q24QS4_DESHY|nr:hypothetical protein DSY3829 [Desulfitobacterium hafniense Y51]